MAYRRLAHFDTVYFFLIMLTSMNKQNVLKQNYLSNYRLFMIEKI